MYPDDRRYSKNHEWIIVTGGEARVGITEYAQDQLGDVVYVELPEEDQRRYGKNKVGLLLRSMYGTQDASHIWHLDYSALLASAGLPWPWAPRKQSKIWWEA